MKNRFVSTDSSGLSSRTRIKEVNILLPNIRAEFYVRLYTLLEVQPEVIEEGYEIFIRDTVTGKEFSAGLTGFGPGYFANENSGEMIALVTQFHESLLRDLPELKDCQLEIEHDFGKSVLGCKNGQVFAQDLED